MKETLTISELADKAETIEDVILAYCEGTAHLEFDAAHLDEMVGKIKALVAKAICEDLIEHGSYVER